MKRKECQPAFMSAEDFFFHLALCNKITT